MKTALAAALLATIFAFEAPAASLLPPACVKAGMDMGGMGGHAADDGTAGMASEDHQRDNMAGMKQMNADMMIGMMAKDPDIAFACGMIAHHQGAIAMSEVELKHGKDEWARRMAETIIAAQKAEIAEMTRWVEAKSAK